MGFKKWYMLWLLTWHLHGVMNSVQGQDLQVGFYGFTCPTAEQIVTNTVQQAFLLDNTITAGLIRLLFHDCFVVGCDASILLIGPNSEQLAVPNSSVRGYEVIANAKLQLETVCPGIVSCADIIALAARDAVGLLGGPTYQVYTGRLDGLIPGNVILPSPTDGVLSSTALFASVGLTQQDMVTLLGAHSVGTSQCQFFSNRLFNYNNTGLPDPLLNTTYLARLQALCPPNGTGTVLVPLNFGSEFLIGTSYYTNVWAGRGLLTIDAELPLFTNTSVYVQNYAGVANKANNLNITFYPRFVEALTKLGTLNLKTSIDGEVRRVCASPNF